MSECNHCNLKWIRKNAKTEKKKVTVLADALWGMGGVNVYVHPPKVKISKLPDGEDGERKQYFVAWFMAVGDSCEC